MVGSGSSVGHDALGAQGSAVLAEASISNGRHPSGDNAVLTVPAGNHPVLQRLGNNSQQLAIGDAKSSDEAGRGDASPTLSDSSETMTTQTSLPCSTNNPAPGPGAHANLSLAGNTGFGYAAKTNAVPLVATELPTACRHFPIVFTDGDQPTPVAVLGVRGQENLFVDAQANGAPAPHPGLRAPLSLHLHGERGPQPVHAVRGREAASVVEGRDNPFFDEAGEPDLARSALEFCRDYQNQHAYTMEFARALAEADLLVENRADITCPTASAWPCPASK